MSAMKRSVYIELLKNLKVLRYYVPDKLFAESNLPQVRVFLSPIQNGCEVNGRYRIKLASEDVSLVFSSAGYLPGKPTYRTRHSVIIPLNNDNIYIIYIKHKDLVTKIDNYYQGKVRSLSSMISLPDELLYVADYMLGAKQVRLYSDVESIHVIRPTNVIRLMSNVVECYNCVFLPRDTKAHIPVRRLSGGVDYFHIYLPSSNSYSRHFIYLESSSYNPIDEFEINDLGELRIFDNVFVHNLVYAIDVDARIRGPYCSPNIQQCKTVRAQYQHFCVVLPRSVERNKTRTPRKIKTRKLQFVKVFIDDKEQSKATPVAIGYRISNTFLLKFDTKGKFYEAMLAICQSVGQDVKDRMTLSQLYKKLTVNTGIINFVKHILSYDLVSSYYFSKLKLVRIDQFIKYIFLVNDILSQGLTATITAQPDVSNVANKIFESLRSGLDNLRTDKVQMLRYLVFTTRDGELGFFTDDKEPEDEIREYGLNEIRKRLHNVLESQKQVSKKKTNREDWRCGVLLDLIRHTYGHHLIKVISQSANVDSNKLIESYVERKWEPVLVIERDRGGLGILQGALDEYKRDTYRAYRDLILSFGKCLVGTPEDVLHFILADNFRNRLCEAKPRELARVIEEFVRDRMELLLLPEELTETVRLWHSIRMEAQRLVELLPQEKLRNAIRPDCALLKEIHESRYQLEKTIYRFPELDELIVYLLLNMQKGQILHSLVKELLERSLNVAGKSSQLRQIYDNKDNYIELFLDEMKSVLKNGCGTRGAVPRICASRRKGKYPPDVVYAVKALGRIMRGMLLRLALLTCNSACGHCYVNTRSCSRFSAPFIQARTLDRRVAKIVASEFVKLGFDGIQNLYSPDFEPDVVARLKKGHYSKVNLEIKERDL